MIDFTRVKDNQLDAYVIALEKALGLKEIGATAEELLRLPADELAGRLSDAKAEQQTRVIIPEPPAPPPTELDGWRMAEGYPRRSTTARGTFDVQITDGKRSVEFLSLSDGGGDDPLAWAVSQLATLAEDEAAYAIATGQAEPVPYLWPEEVRRREKLGEFAEDVAPEAEVEAEPAEVIRGN